MAQKMQNVDILNFVKIISAQLCENSADFAVKYWFY